MSSARTAGLMITNRAAPTRSAGSRELKTTAATCFKYSCAQNSARARKQVKVTDASKQRDKIPLTTFDCGGWLFITVSEASDVALVKLEHKLDHVHYSDNSVPDDVRELLRNCGNKTMSQVRCAVVASVRPAQAHAVVARDP